jgi:NifU-like protein involved in Fe-S cluster formation/bacterioferritin-associated ferredoxin
MTDPFARYREHAAHPHRIGEVPAATHAATIVGSRPGQTIRVSVVMDDLGRITDLAYRTDAAGPTLAACSVFADMVVGRTLREALAIHRAQILEQLGPIPPDAGAPVFLLHAALLRARPEPAARKELAAGIADADVVCWCFRVTGGEIRAAIRDGGLTTVDQVRAKTKANCGCGTCRPEVESLLAEPRRRPPA